MEAISCEGLASSGRLARLARSSGRAMPIAQSLTPHNTVDVAITRVLQAEADAAAAVAAAEQQATALTEASRGAVRALDERTERRIRAVRSSFEARTAHAIAELDAQTAASTDGELDATDLAAIEAAVQAFAARLTTPP